MLEKNNEGHRHGTVVVRRWRLDHICADLVGQICNSQRMTQPIIAAQHIP